MLIGKLVHFLGVRKQNEDGELYFSGFFEIGKALKMNLPFFWVVRASQQ